MTKSKPVPLTALRILGHDFVLAYQDSYAAAHADDAGSVDCGANRIFVSSTMAESRQEETLVHEILEALFYCMGVDPKAGFTFTHDHLSVLSEGLYQVLKDNEGFWRAK